MSQKYSEAFTEARVIAERRSRFNPIATLTPQKLTTALEQFSVGYLGDAARIWDALQRRDDKIAALRAKRLAALSRNGWEIVVTDDTPEASAQKAALEFTFNHLTATHALDADQSGGLSLLLRQMGDAIGMKYAVHELCWEPVQTPQGWQMALTARFAPLWFFENTTGRMRFIKTTGGAIGEEMDAMQWMVSVSDTALMEPSSVLYIYKRLPLTDWLSYSERFGSPAVIGRTPAAEGSDAGRAMAAAVSAVGSDMECVIYGDNGDSKIDFARPDGGTGSLPFPDLVRRSEEALAVLWQGGDLSTMSSAAGQGTGASLQGDSLAKLEADDAQWASEILQSQIARRVIAWKFGADAEVKAYIRVKTSAAARDARLDLAVISKLVELGAPVAISDALETFGKTTPDEGEPLLTRPEKPAAPQPVAMANERQTKQMRGFMAEAARDAAAALGEDLAPIRARLEPLRIALENGDDRAAKDAAVMLRELLPVYAAGVLKQPSALQYTLQQILAPAVIDGIARSTKANKTRQ